MLKCRRLKRRLLVSGILFGLILALYVLEGFTIAAAQSFAHVRSLIHAEDIGHPVKGEEDEKWLMPWGIYILLQGGLVVLSACMIWAMGRELKQLDQGCTKEKGKCVKRSDDKTSGESAPGEIELQTINAEDERSRLLPVNEDDPEGTALDKGEASGDEVQDEVKEPNWEALGFRPTSNFHSTLPSAPLTGKPNPASPIIQPYNGTTIEPNPFGEGPSNGAPFVPDYRSQSPMYPSSPPVPLLPETTQQWLTERSHAEVKLQRQISKTKRNGKVSENDAPSREDHVVLLGEQLMANTSADRRNSWAQEEEHKIVMVDESLKGKGKEKEEVKRYEEQHERSAPDLPSGIELDREYRFIDGLPYPLLLIPSRRRGAASSTTENV
ncbi:MAG: hypothetical protein Q9179_006083, partial [Wetmoreana sp. 5 TL-2023]